MRTLAETDALHEVLRRIANLHPQSEARWGRMTPHQAICHLTDSFRGCMGEKPMSMAPAIPGQRRFMKWFALYVPLPWPRNIPTRPEMDQRVGGTPPSHWEQDRSDLLRVIQQFRNPAQRTPHPMFGHMKHRDWMRWAYLHIDHHLRQFGL
jgi:hypothetical protein